MTRFHGKVGFVKATETAPGVWTPTEVAKPYFGDVNREGYRWEQGKSLNDQPVVTNYLSIVADKFAYENLGAIRWVEWLGQKWKVNSVEVARPRITITIGGLWNGTDQD